MWDLKEIAGTTFLQLIRLMSNRSVGLLDIKKDLTEADFIRYEGS